jgi:hypothetical protein
MVVRGRRGRRRRRLLDNLKKTRGYLKLKDEAPDRTLWRTNFARSYGHIVIQTRKWSPTAGFVKKVTDVWILSNDAEFLE